MALPALGGLSIGLGLGQGFAFGTGYGAGVRFGYEDVYPYLKGNMSQIANFLQIPYASSGFKLASGVTEAQGRGLGLGSPQNINQPMGLSQPAPQPNSMRLTTAELQQVSKIYGRRVVSVEDFWGGKIQVTFVDGKTDMVFAYNHGEDELYKTLYSFIYHNN